MEPDRSIVVYGAGAVGGYLAGRLTLAGGSSVTLIGRGRVAEAVRSDGLRLRQFGGESVLRLPATDTAATVAPCDLVLFSVRTPDVATALPGLQRLVGKEGHVLALQNGVGTEEDLARALGRERILPGTLTVSCGMEEPGVITRYSKGGGVALSSMTHKPVPAWIVQMFTRTALPTALIPDYRALRWSKLLLNMLAAATSAILDSDIDLVIGDPRVFRLEQLAFREAGRVMDAQGIQTVRLPSYPVPLARLLMRLPPALARATLGRRLVSARGGRSPGMRNDMARGKSEIGSFNGAVVEAGRRLGIPTPVNRFLTSLTLDLVENPRLRPAFQANPDALVAVARERGIRI